MAQFIIFILYFYIFSHSLVLLFAVFILLLRVMLLVQFYV